MDVDVKCMSQKKRKSSNRNSDYNNLLGYTQISKDMKVKVLVKQPCLTLCDPMVCPWNSPGKNNGMGCHSLLQKIFPTQGANSPSLI